MNIKKHFYHLLVVLLTGCFFSVSLAFAAIQTGNNAYDNTIQTELDRLLTEVANMEIVISDNYQEASEFNSILNSGIRDQGTMQSLYDLAIKLEKQAKANPDDLELQEKSQIALDQLLLFVLYQIIENRELATLDLEISQALIDILEGKPGVEAFSDEPGFLFGGINGREIPSPIPPDPDPDPDPDPTFTFRYYGKDYNLATDIDLANSTNGVLWFVQGPPVVTFDEKRPAYGPYIAPFWYEEWYDDDWNEGDSTQQTVFTIPTVNSNENFYRYTWSKLHPDLDADQRSIPPISASLYKNNWISFVYGDFGEMDGGGESFGIYTELYPGDGDQDFHPGTGIDREWDGTDFADADGESPYNDYNEYLGIYHDNYFNLSDMFVVFIPDASDGFIQQDEGIGNQYKVVGGGPLMIVDRSRHDLDEASFEGYSSLDQAIISIADGLIDLDDPLTNFKPGNASSTGEVLSWDGLYRWAPQSTLSNGASTSGEYFYGLQTVGYFDGNNYQYTPEYIQERIEYDQSNFLAYAVQVEEDIVNVKLMKMADQRIWEDYRADLINDIRTYKNIRDRDAAFVEKADAQAGRVMKDINGNWVRVQQYVLRPDANTVQILNVTLRDATSGNLAGLSTINFTTNFIDPIYPDMNLKDLPWGSYLSTDTDIDGMPKIYNPEGPELNNMSVEFTNAGNESVKEARGFYDRYTGGAETNAIAGMQYVKYENLYLNAADPSYINTFGDPTNGTFGTAAYKYVSNFNGTPAPDKLDSGYYASNNGVISDLNADDKILDVHFYELNDFNGQEQFNNSTNGDELAAKNIWEVLGAGEATLMGRRGGFPGDSSIEIAMSSSESASFKLTKPISTVYIPMSHMMWALKEGFDDGDTDLVEP